MASNLEKTSKRARTFHDASRMAVLPTAAGLQALRLAWLAMPGSDSRFAALAWAEDEFDAQSLQWVGLGSGAVTSFPWLHGSSAFKLMAQSILCDSLDASACENISLFASTAHEHAFSVARTENFFSFHQFQNEDDLLDGAKLLCAAMPNALLFDSQGFEFDPGSIASLPRRQFELGLDYFDLENGNPSAPAFDPEVQVVDDANVCWLSISGAARALGAPSSFSTSRMATRRLLAHGDVLGAANRIASSDAALFKHMFKDAIHPYDMRNPHQSKRDACTAFVLADRRAALEASSMQANHHAPASRL